MADKNDNEAVSKKKEEETEDEIASYWTEERMKSAQPLPMEIPDEKEREKEGKEEQKK